MFNALKYNKELQEAGFSAEQAEATVNVFVSVMEEQLATKEDIKVAVTELKSELKNELRTEIGGLRTEIGGLKVELSELRYNLQSLEYKLTIRLGLMQAASIGILATFIKFH